jgi:hypothetical protein
MDTSWIRELFSKESSMSSMRWVLIWTWLFVIVVTWSTWATLCIINRVMIDIPLGVAGLVSSVLLIVTGGKAWQQVTENKAKALEKDCGSTAKITP